MNQMGMSEEQLLAASQLYAPSTKGPLITEIQKLMNEMNNIKRSSSTKRGQESM